MSKGEIEIRCKINTYSTLALTVEPIMDKRGEDKRYRYYYVAKVEVSHISTTCTLYQTQERTKIEALSAGIEFLDVLGASTKNIISDSSSLKVFLSSTKKRTKGPNKRAIKEALSSYGA